MGPGPPCKAVHVHCTRHPAVRPNGVCIPRICLPCHGCLCGALFGWRKGYFFIILTKNYIVWASTALHRDWGWGFLRGRDTGRAQAVRQDSYLWSWGNPFLFLGHSFLIRKTRGLTRWSWRPFWLWENMTHKSERSCGYSQGYRRGEMDCVP